MRKLGEPSSIGRIDTQLARFVLSGGAGAALDLALLTVLVEIGGLGLALATVFSLTLACLVHFALNMRWVFDARGDTASRLARYAVMLTVTYAVTLALVLGLSSVGVWYPLAKTVAVAACAGVNFLAYRHWVFR